MTVASKMKEANQKHEEHQPITRVEEADGSGKLLKKHHDVGAKRGELVLDVRWDARRCDGCDVPRTLGTLRRGRPTLASAATSSMFPRTSVVAPTAAVAERAHAAATVGEGGPGSAAAQRGKGD